jgi:hypothetical protein
VKRFLRQRRIDLERELRAQRPEPRPELVTMISGRVERSRSRGRVRLAFGAALTAALLVAVASVGGVGFAASSANQVAKSIIRITHTSHPRVVNRTAAGDQYGRKVKVCHKGHVISISESALPAHKAHGDQVVSNDAKVGSKCGQFRAGKAGRRGGAPTFTG